MFRQFLSKYKLIIGITVLFLVVVAIVVAQPNNTSQVEGPVRFWEQKSVCGDFTFYQGFVKDGVLVSLEVPGEKCKGFLPTLFCVRSIDKSCVRLTDEEAEAAIVFFNDLKSSGPSP